ncbi:MFS transporter [Azospirillum sp. TSO22-1]|uniref:MFS transporter n=1 Tax=Azospirillum sp. TSO22-1 TaxID=716789 RepID=UPI000D619B95|nr:MFS transporter [Azospirillum sp. TSO22-1]PWC52495.1 MFS transporter permease [Azospirillum sp. TSO22-1]
MTGDPIRALVLRLTVVTVAVLLLAAGGASWLTLSRFDAVFQPELARKADMVGTQLAAQIDRGLGYGIPLDRMPGLDRLFQEEEQRHADIAYLAASDPQGRVLASSGRPVAARVSGVAADRVEGRLAAGFVDMALPLRTGWLHVGVDAAYLAKASTGLMLDVLSVVLVAVLLIFEILLLVVHLAMGRVLALRALVERAAEGDLRAAPPEGGTPEVAETTGAFRRTLDALNERHAALTARLGALDPADPRRERAQALLARFRFREPGASPMRPFNLVYLRLPVFLFCLSEELSRPFLPAYSKSFAPAVPWLTPDLVVGLPITLFMLIWAMSQPGGARMSERWGRGRAFLAGALLGSVSLALTATAGSLGELLLWRCLTALGYGLVLITAQGIVVDHTTLKNRAGGMAMYIGALLAAGVCGPVTGGIIADQVGIEATFLVGSALALGSGLTVTALLKRAGVPATAGNRAPLSAGWPLLRTPRFASLMLFSAVPTKIAATAFLFCLVPLLLTSDGASKTEVGRVQMMYFVAFVLVSPLAASLSDRWQARRGFIALGGVGTLVSCLPLLLSGAWWAAPLGIGLFGLFQALVGAPQLTLVSQIARDGGLPETAAIGWYRLIERLGAALGPVVALWAAIVWSYREAMLAVGLLCGVSAVLFWLADRAASAHRHPAAPLSRTQEA